MGPAYIKAVRENLPEAALVFDHFHVIKLYNKKLSDLRRAVANEADGLKKNAQRNTLAVADEPLQFIGGEG